MSDAEEVKALFQTFLVEIRKEFMDQWQRFEDHCRLDMTAHSQRICEVEEWMHGEVAKDEAALTASHLKSSWGLVGAKLTEAAIVLIGVLVGVYLGHKVF